MIVYHFPENDKPVLQSIHFRGFATNMVFVDRRNNRWWVGLNHKHWGQKLHYSDDNGASWNEVSTPSFSGFNLPDGGSAKLRQIWCMVEAGRDRQNELWLGTDPGGLFYSKDGGNSFQLVKSLWEHPSRTVEGWFGAGSDLPFIHSIVVNPENADHVYVAVSCAGVFETTDGGESWHPKNTGLKAAYLPNPSVEVGHDPHVLLMSPIDTKVLWQQNHCGIYHSMDGGESWVDCSDKSGLPSYGFCMVIDEKDSAKAWVIPVQSDEERISPDLKMAVYHTDNFGDNWKSTSEGLPTKNCFDIVLRQAFAKQRELFVFGTTAGNLYYRHGSDSRWHQLESHLTKVNSVFLW